MALAFGLLLFTIGAGRQPNAADAGEDSQSSHFSLDKTQGADFKPARNKIPSGQLL
jgi:hypothetical protein